jgi:hypothetical protein
MADQKLTPEQIVEVLHSIKRLSIESGELDTWFENGYLNIPETIRSFVPGSFTRRLLELIEGYLLEDNND